MDYTLSPDQKLFRSSSADLLDKEVPLSKVRELGAAGIGYDRDWWRRGAELGWTAMLASEEFGGDSISGSGLADIALVAQEMGSRVSPGPLAVTNALIASLSRMQNAADHSDVIEGAIGGEVTLAWAVAEPGQAWAPTAPTLAATRSGSGWTLHGQKVTVESGDQADQLVVTAGTDDGPVQLLVPADADGVTITPEKSLDAVRRYATITFDQCSVPDGAQLISAGSTQDSIEAQLQTLIALQSVETIGVLDRVLEFTIQWAFDRYSFGRPLASYQALKHRFSDMFTWLQAATASADGAVAAINAGDAQAAELVDVAAAFVGKRSTDIIQDCVQMHGGIGVTWEHDIHLYLRRATVNRAAYGTPNDHLRRIAARLSA